MAKSKKQEELEQQIAELTADLQRTRADFENYRKRVDLEKQQARTAGESMAILRLLPVIDNIERAVKHAPSQESRVKSQELEQWRKWSDGIGKLVNNLEKALESMNLKRIEAKQGMPFNPELHEAVQFDEDAKGDHEVIAEELQAGYTLNGQPIRPSMVKVTRK